MAKYSIYAVAIGRDPYTKEMVYGKKFSTWNEAQPYIKGVEGAKYKGFLTDHEANEWINKILSKTHVENPHLPDLSQLTPPKMLEVRPEQLEEATNIQGDFLVACNAMNLNPHQVILHLQKQFVDTVMFISGNICKEDEAPVSTNHGTSREIDVDLPFD